MLDSNNRRLLHSGCHFRMPVPHPITGYGQRRWGKTLQMACRRRAPSPSLSARWQLDNSFYALKAKSITKLLAYRIKQTCRRMKQIGFWAVDNKAVSSSSCHNFARCVRQIFFSLKLKCNSRTHTHAHTLVAHSYMFYCRLAT